MTKAKPSGKLWQKILVRLVGIPGYGVLFAGLVLFPGMIAAIVYVWATDPVIVERSVVQHESQATGAYWPELLLMLVVTVAAWVGIAYFCGKIVAWLAARFGISQSHVISLKLGLLIGGWLGVALTFSLIATDYDYVMLFVAAAMIALGSLSFALEALILRIWRLSSDATW